MNKTKNFFVYKNKIFLANGSSIIITSNKYIKNYQLNLKSCKTVKIVSNETTKNKNKLNFIKNIF